MLQSMGLQRVENGLATEQQQYDLQCDLQLMGARGHMESVLEGLKTKVSNSSSRSCLWNQLPGKTLDTWLGRASLLILLHMCYHASSLEEISAGHMTPRGKDNWKLPAGTLLDPDLPAFACC